MNNPNYITRQDIAKMVNILPRYVPEVLEKQPDFPRPALMLSSRFIRWDRKDVEAWLEKQRQKNRR